MKTHTIKPRVIVLGAGQGFKLDGLNKLLIKDPTTGDTIIEKYTQLFAGHAMTVVVGYKAVAVMSEYPKLNYVYNEDWRLTGNSYSLSLALDDKPVIILSADLIFDTEMVTLINTAPANAVITFNAENKGLNTVRCKVKRNIVRALYLGEGFNNDPESPGIYKITDTRILREWKKRCIANRNVFAGLNLPTDLSDIYAVDKRGSLLHEINTPIDYLNLISQATTQHQIERL